ncbi:ATP synthase subunit I [Desulforamulus putei]|uniref:ATP synthase I chain n=1 Tax=Desulforamulus putei DSM 12395 TaxID=1121429 RepID=A0A1M4XUL2_9FIRM|nr:ATP synthase subunit I [Desulforamulus putei]SHE96932.1 ATP synthase I chain [Desulforamulus putei DSM 12395]
MLGSTTIPSLEVQLKRTVKCTAIVVALMALAVVVDYQNAVYKGFLIGSLVSLQNAILLSKRIKKASTIKDVGKAIAYMRRGFFIRLILIMATLWLSVRIPSVSVHAAAVGLFVAPVLSISDFLITLLKESVLNKDALANKVNSFQREGGENA